MIKHHYYLPHHRGGFFSPGCTEEIKSLLTELYGLVPVAYEGESPKDEDRVKSHIDGSSLWIAEDGSVIASISWAVAVPSKKERPIEARTNRPDVPKIRETYRTIVSGAL